MTPGLRIRLSAMMFLEFFVWGAWYGVLENYLNSRPPAGLGFGDNQVSWIFSLFPLASIILPLVAGQVTDRIIPAQVFLGFAHLIGAVGLYLAARSTEYGSMFTGILVWSIAYAPTISLTNSLAFSHVKDAEKDFGPIRVLGTIGWIAAGWALTGWRNSEGLAIGGNDCLYLGAAVSLLMGFFCFSLPHTPPARSGVSPWAFLKALRLLKNPRIAVFLLISLVVAVEFPFYFMFTNSFLQSLGTSKANTPLVLTIAQLAEIFTMLALPWFLKTLGPRKTLFLGVMAWPIRYLVFAVGKPYWLVVASLALHGMCFVCFFVVAFIYIDAIAPKDIKASAQGLLTLVIYGLGMFFGSIFAGMVKTHFTDANQTVNWTGVFLVPSVLTIACALVLFVTFPRGSMQEVSAGENAASGEEQSPGRDRF